MRNHPSQFFFCINFLQLVKIIIKIWLEAIMDKLTKIKEFILKDRRILASVISFVLLFAIFLTQLFVRYNMKSKVEI